MEWPCTALCMENKYDEAMKCYNKALEIDPSFVKALDNKGFILYLQKNHTEAIKYFDKALKIDPSCKILDK